jgi:hypothetical protein
VRSAESAARTIEERGGFMRSDGPLILAVVSLAAGLGVIFSYGVGTTAFNAAYPLSGANLQLSIATAGPAAVGGLALVALGLLILAWALLCAFVGLFQPVSYHGEHPSRLERLELKRKEREAVLEQKRLAREEKLLERQRAYPKD